MFSGVMERRLEVVANSVADVFDNRRKSFSSVTAWGG